MASQFWWPMDDDGLQQELWKLNNKLKKELINQNQQKLTEIVGKRNRRTKDFVANEQVRKPRIVELPL